MKKYHFDKLALSGSGVIGLAYIGALEIIAEKLQPISEFKQIVGTSVGSILAIMCALHYSPAEMKQIILDLDLKELADNKIYSLNLGIADILKLVVFHKGYGCNSGNFLQNWVDGLIKEKVGKSNATFADLKNAQKFADIYITAANISKHEMTVFSAQDTPDIVISEAVRASTSVPILFDAMEIRGNIYVDGGIYDNYPINIFSEDLDNVLGISFNEHPMKNIIQHHNVTPENMGSNFGWHNYIIAIMGATFISQSINNARQNIRKDTILIDSAGIDPLNLDCNNTQKMTLFEEGYNKAKAYFCNSA